MPSSDVSDWGLACSTSILWLAIEQQWKYIVWLWLGQRDSGIFCDMWRHALVTDLIFEATFRS